MRNLPFRNVPIALPIIAVFHVLCLGYGIWLFHTEPLTDLIWMQVVWLLAYTVCWGLLTWQHKWAANVYIGLTALGLVLRFTLKDEHLRNALLTMFFPIDLLCSMMVLILWKRIFRK